MIHINVVGQQMKACTSLNGFVSGSQEFVRFKFNLSEEWSGLKVFAQFVQNGTGYNQYLDKDNCVYLPAEIKAGRCTLVLYGSLNSVIATANCLTFVIDNNHIISDAQSTEISESLYNQLVSKFNELERNVESFVNNEDVTKAINDAVSQEISEYLDSGKLAYLTIQDGSIDERKLDEGVVDILESVAVSNNNKKTVNGEIITISDTSPLKHELSVNLKSDTITDFSNITVFRYGKNLFNALAVVNYGGGNAFDTLEATENKIIATRSNTGMKVSNNDKSNHTTLFSLIPSTEFIYITPGQYIFSATITTENDKIFDDYNLSPNTIIWYINNKTLKTFKLGHSLDKKEVSLLLDVKESGYLKASYYRSSGGLMPEDRWEDSIYKVIIENPQLEMGSVATDYEPYVESQSVTANVDGTTEGLTSVYPTMSILSNSDSVKINCEYNADKVDQEYNPKSKNAQSGIAVDEALSSKAEQSTIDDMRWRSISANALTWVIGTLNPSLGNEGVSTTRLRSDYVYLEAGSVIKSDGNYIVVYYYDSDRLYLEGLETSWIKDSITIERTGYVRILLRFADSSTVTEENKSTLIDGTKLSLQFGDVSMATIKEMFKEQSSKITISRAFNADDFIGGSLTNGLPTTVNPISRIYTDNYFLINEGDIIKFDNSLNTIYRILVAYYDSDKNFISQTSWKTSDIISTQNGYVRIVIGTNNYTEIADDYNTVASMVTIDSGLNDKMSTIEGAFYNISDKLEGFTSYADKFDYLTKVAEFASLYKNTGKIDSFLYFTDPHLLSVGDTTKFYDKFVNYTEVLGEFYNRTPTTFVLCNGDWLEWNDTQENALYKLSIMTGQMKKLFGENYYPAFGNHDNNYQGDKTNGEPTLSNSVIKNVMFPFQNSMYYRFEGQTGSFYVLDSGSDQSSAMTDYRWEQIDWLANDLKTSDKQYSAISMHIIWGSAGTNMLTTDITPFATNVNTIIEAYNNRSIITLNSIEYDFTGCSGKVYFIIGGHGHVDNVDTENYAVPMILTLAMYYGTSPSFDMVLVDWEGGALNMVRVGTGENRTISI